MTENNDEGKILKFPKSISGRQCIGPCYYPNVEYAHPHEENAKINVNEPTCPIIKVYTKDDRKSIIYDTCAKPTHRIYKYNDFKLNSLSKDSKIKTDSFLKGYYDIYSFEDSLNFIHNNNVPRITKNRILNMSLEVYGKNIVILDKKTIEFIIKYIIDNIHFILKEIKNYIHINEKTQKIYLSIPDNDNNTNTTDTDTDTDTDLKIEYIKTNFLIYVKMYKFIMKYIENKKNELNKNRNHLGDIVKLLTIYIKNKIIKTIKL
jgi:hypothetical protein